MRTCPAAKFRLMSRLSGLPRNRVLPRVVPVVLVFLLLFSHVAARADEKPSFFGAQTCGGCHAAEFEAWKRSHHALAMQPATATTVLGNFANASFEQFGITTTFYRDGDRYMVRTDGPDGTLHDYPIAYTFGVYPLQQYLIAFPGGRYQTLGIAWDSRPTEAGGQRWYALYPDQKLKPGEPLHWTGRDQTWNYQCADCHSTDLRKNFDLATNTYATTFSDVSVACEACHGPGSRHVTWAQQKLAGAPSTEVNEGIVAWLKASDRGVWQMNETTGIAQRTEPAKSTAVMDACGTCHARRSVIVAGDKSGQSFLEGHLPALLEQGLYHADGQIDGEVYEYGSFVQSKMFQAGVNCINCHDPHAGGRVAQGNSLCAQCHLPQKFDVADHHHHQPGTPGAQCANCHMPTKTYMGVDVRHDHSFRVPRPDLTEQIAVPNACNQCHADKPTAWAIESIPRWYPNGRQMAYQYGTAIHAGRAGAIDAETQLDTLIRDRNSPPIARASALLLLSHYATSASEGALVTAINDASPLVRLAAPRALSSTTTPAVIGRLPSLLMDPVRAVRIQAARALAGTGAQALTPAQQRAFGAAYRELVAAELVNADRPEAHLNLGLLDVRQGQQADAEAEYKTALRLDPLFVPALVDLADLDRMGGMGGQGLELLTKALSIEPANADVHHALGLLLIRQHDYEKAREQLRQASQLAPDNTRYLYVYAVAVNSAGNSAEAMTLLERAHQQSPTDRDVLVALVSIARARGDQASALRAARELAKLLPADQQVRALVRQLEDK
jgi:Tfp pilus assembly protein PilF